MRVFALSDIHVDYQVNANWIRGLSQLDYKDDVLILAGDVSHSLALLAWCLGEFTQRFKRVLFVPGNHDLWVIGEAPEKTSLQKFGEVAEVVVSSGASMHPFVGDNLLIVPLFGWYDYTFGEPGERLKEIWMDYRACRWPAGYGAGEITAHFAGLNRHPRSSAQKIITFSHFLPRVDVLPALRQQRMLDPVLGSTLLDAQLRRLNSSLHVYGHSHINRNVRLDGITYVNNAFGYPHENGIAAKRLLCIHET